jgi:hypothetical protein
LITLGIVALHLVHLGCNLGPKILEMLEEESDWIHQLGNWNPSVQDSNYSTKLPMRPIRKLAGFVHANGMHYNPRTMVEVPEELARITLLADGKSTHFPMLKLQFPSRRSPNLQPTMF